MVVMGESMRKILCYRRGCSNKASWEIPGRQPLHLCTSCLRRLHPNLAVEDLRRIPMEVSYGPTEFKENQDESTTKQP